MINMIIELFYFKNIYIILLLTKLLIPMKNIYAIFIT